MKILHTSDWHLGRTLCGRKRHEEQQAFLNWLVDQIGERQIDAILIAGDIFDNGTPDNKAQAQYYRFLFDVAQTTCRHIIVTGGNHDSPLFLEAPRELLRLLNVHVIGQISDQLSDEVIVLNNQAHEPSAIVCAVPFLRDRDIRQIEAGEDMQDKNRKLLTGIQQHYQAVTELALQMRGIKKEIPLIAMGHLFTQGGRTLDDDGVRDLYVGSLAHIPVDAFPDSIDYLALGHLHVPQTVGKRAVYSGSPIPMGFQEAQQIKKVMVVTFTGQKPLIEAVDVPTFVLMETIEGDLQTILKRLNQLQSSKQAVNVEIWYTGQQPISGLREKVEEISQNPLIDVCRIRNRAMTGRGIDTSGETEYLSELNEIEVFDRCLDQYEVSEAERTGLTQAYWEIIDAIKISSSSDSGSD